MGLPPIALLITILRALWIAPFCISNTISSRKFASNSNSLSTGDGLWGSSSDGGANPVLLPGSTIRRGVDGADARVIGFLLFVCFQLDTLALIVEWSSRATRLVAIASKPLRPNLSPTFEVETFVVLMGGEVRGGT